MHVLAAIAGSVLLLFVLLDTFETIVLPRRVTRRFRLTTLFYRYTWRPYRALARRIRDGKQREALLGFYGPASLLLLLGLWAVGVTVAFALLQYAAGSALKNPNGASTFRTDLYFSGTTVFTLGLGDVLPLTTAARFLTVFESAIGLGLLALVVGYFPVIYQSFSRREMDVALLDGHAGTPPSAGELLRRYRQGMGTLSSQVLREWERWSADVLESHISYPVLAYFRSQHDNQSWLASLTAILDASALLTLCLPEEDNRQAYLTFAMARHAVVDLANIFHTPPRPPEDTRLPNSDFVRLRVIVRAAGLPIEPDLEPRLAALRRIYEPYAKSLSEHLLIALPPWIPTHRPPNWLTTAWGRTTTPFSVSEPFESTSDDRG